VYKVIPETISPCVQGVPCSTTYINWFGFVTIPLLSLIAYGAILVLLILGKKGKFKDEK
jgi:disulfide bond formation protein DsbB